VALVPPNQVTDELREFRQEAEEVLGRNAAENVAKWFTRSPINPAPAPDLPVDGEQDQEQEQGQERGQAGRADAVAGSGERA
jgi:hypothetical protein